MITHPANPCFERVGHISSTVQQENEMIQNKAYSLLHSWHQPTMENQLQAIEIRKEKKNKQIETKLRILSSSC
jgi:hypothetical protein